MPKLVFITGASSGVGRTLARRFYAAGYSLALIARCPSEIKAWADSCGISAKRCQLYSADVSITDSIVVASNACLATQGVPDVVIACAGISVGVDSA